MTGTDAEWAWAAGLFEGEGCISTNGNGAGGIYVRLVIAMTDEDVLLRFAAITGRGQVRGPFRPPSAPADRKARYEWRCTNRHDAAFVLSMLWPWLGERRRARAREVCGLSDTRLSA